MARPLILSAYKGTRHNGSAPGLHPGNLEGSNPFVSTNLHKINMKSRNVTLTLEKAKEFYNSGNTALREVALQAFTAEELTTLNFTDIKTFKDACKALNLNVTAINIDICFIQGLKLEANATDHLIAIYKLDIIRKALNKGWNPKMTEGSVYYPYIRFYPAGNKAKEAARSNGWDVKETFNADGQKYALVGGAFFCYACVGLADLDHGYGGVRPGLGLLGCKSKEIAKHMSRYFAKEIFEATYAQHVGIYEWCENI